MQHFQTILIVIGLLAIAAVLIHGYLISRKDKMPQNGSADNEPNLADENVRNNEGEDLDTFNMNNHEDENVDEYLLHIKDDNLETDDLIIENLTIENEHHSIQLDDLVLHEIDSDMTTSEDQVKDQNEQENVNEEQNPNPVSINENDEVLTQEPIPANKEKSIEEAQDIFIFNVVAKEDGYIRGHTLLQFFLTAGFRFGKMNIFHRHLHSDGTGPILFSIANMMAPGVFHPTKMKHFHSEGVSFFLTAPNDEINIKEAFDMMLVAVQQMADEFDCIVLNADREPMTEEQFREYHKRLLRYI